MGYHEGIPSVWAGTIPSLVLVSQPTIKFTIYEFLKRHYLQLYGKNIWILNLSIKGDQTIYLKVRFTINSMAIYFQQTNWH